MSVPHGIAKIKVSVEIEGEKFEATSVSWNYAVNSIPTAQATVALGKNPKSGKIAQIHNSGLLQKTMKPAKIYVEATGDMLKGKKWPGGRQLVFDGYYTHVGYNKARGQASAVLSFVHWLADMQFSTMLSSRNHPTNPTDVTTSIDGRFPGSGAAGGKAIFPHLAGHSFFERGKVQSDLWGRSLQPFLESVCRQKIIRMNDDLEPINDNTLALDALKKFVGSGGGKAYAPKLAMKMGAIGAAVSTAIASQINGIMSDPVFSQTLWDALISRFAPVFMFSVIPLPDKALCVPMLPGIRETYKHKIVAADCGSISLSGEMLRPMRGVVVYLGLGRTQNGSGTAQPSSIGGGYPKRTTGRKGVLLVRQCPTWMSTYAGYAQETKNTILDTKRSNVTPDGAAGKNPKTQKDEQQNSKTLLDNYAQALYATEMLQGRGGVINTLLRFDIGPGSNIRLETDNPRSGDNLALPLIGTVLQVSGYADAEASQAGTSFRIGYMRSEKENEQPETSMATHPLYNKAFIGCPLLDAFA